MHLQQPSMDLEAAVQARRSANEQFAADNTLLPRLRKLRREVYDNVTSRKSLDKKTYQLLSFAISIVKYETGAFENSGLDSLTAYIAAVKLEAFSILEVLIDHVTTNEARWRFEFLPGYLATLADHTADPLVVRAALRGLLVYLSRLRDNATVQDLEPQHEMLTGRHLLYFLSAVVSRPCSDYVQEEQTEYATAIIAHLCTTRAGRKACDKYRILDALLARMLQFYVAAKQLNGFSVGTKFTITPAQKSAQLGPVLAAILALLKHEKWARHRFAHLHFWQRIMAPEFQPRGKLGFTGSNFCQELMETQYQPGGKSVPCTLLSIDSFAENVHSDPLSALVVWLYEIVRSETGRCKIAAIYLLVSLSTMELHLPYVFHEWTNGVVLPILVSSLKVEHGSQLQNIVQDDSLYVESAPVQILRALCTVLSCKPDIKFAVSHGVIPKLMAALSATYAIKFKGHMHKWWSPSRDDFSKPGQNIYGEEQDRMHARRPCLQINALREKILEALCYIIDVDASEEYTKTMDDLKQTGAIISCLRNTGEPETINSKKPVGEIYPNSGAVMFMACHLIRLIGRCVKIARTTLFDYELAASLISLLQQDDNDLEITAIGTLTNLLIEWNPHQEKLLELGVADMLYERAKSPDLRIKLASIRALKNLMYRYPPEAKQDCLEKLGLPWLWGCFSGQSTNELVNANGKKPDSNAMEVEPEPVSKTVPQIAASSHKLKSSNEERSEYEIVMKYPTFASALLDRPTQRLIQLSTILFLQNLLTCEGKTACITYIFEQKTYPILDFIQSCSLVTLQRLKTESRSESHVVKQFKQDLSCAALCVLTHIAGSSPNQHLMMENEQHLTSLIKVLRHSAVKVRNNVILLIHNLTVMDSNANEEKCKLRAETLKRLGWLEALKVSANFDLDLDNRETSKRTIAQFAHVGVKPDPE